MSRRFDALILGGGAAGLMCAIEAGKRGRRVAVLEQSERTGKKILISGGGRCNFTNVYCEPENFISANPHFAKSALARFTPADFIALVEKHRIRYHEKTLGQLFCDHAASEITEMLEAECKAADVEIFVNARIRDVRRESEFAVVTNTDEFRAGALVVATGGLSIPKMGATGFGYELASQFGLRIRETNPALVPITFDRKRRGEYCDLAGISADVVASTEKHFFREKMLITHRGLSGPAILQISSYWRAGETIWIDLAPECNISDAIRGAKARNAAARAAVEEILAKRLADRWLNLNSPAAWTNQGIDELEQRLHGWEISPAGTEGYEKAEVTSGGVDTDELSSQTMESRKVKGLFFIGEVVDVTGQLGGFNFQWAWASGAAAGRAL